MPSQTAATPPPPASPAPRPPGPLAPLAALLTLVMTGGILLGACAQPDSPQPEAKGIQRLKAESAQSPATIP